MFQMHQVTSDTVPAPNPTGAPERSRQTPHHDMVPPSLKNSYPIRTQGNGKAAFHLALVFVFLRFSFLHEMIAGILGVDSYLVLAVGAPAVLLAIFSGALQRTFRWRPAQYWAFFVLWMLLALPFSQHDRGASLASVSDYLRTTFLVVFLIGGLTITVRDCCRVMSAIGLAGLFSVLFSLAFPGGVQDSSGLRLALAYGGSLSDPNDYAAHLLMVLPFLFWLGLSTKKKLMRIIYFAAVGLGFITVAKTGSRGAMVAAMAVSFFMVIHAPNKRRALSFIIILVLSIGLTLLLPQALHDRYMSIFSDNSDVAETTGAVASAEQRRYLLTSSMELALNNPLFGVGQNAFEYAEAEIAKEEGRRGAWHAPHNSFMQIASELGIPALFFYLASILTTFRMLNGIYSRCEGRLDLHKLRTGAFCMMVSTIGFGVAIFFINVPYSVYLPALTGLAIALTRATEQELQVAPAASWAIQNNYAENV